ncbi:MAG TPA: ribonuclease T [Gammaproteobacteria bacterium]|nr:ribonuclease T [Gammaproteobacteria bacterium]
METAEDLIEPIEPASPRTPVARRFRGFLPVVVDVETAGFDPIKNALLEIAAVLLRINGEGRWERGETLHSHVLPFEGARLDPEALKFNGIDPYHPFRMALPEKEALEKIFKPVRQEIEKQGCSRAILVGHNAFFDLAFVKAAAERCKIKRSPFHSFTTLDTASLAGLAFGQTVLARAVKVAGLEWNSGKAHSAIYDAELTADLFCIIINRWDVLTSELKT